MSAGQPDDLDALKAEWRATQAANGSEPGGSDQAESAEAPARHSRLLAVMAGAVIPERPDWLWRGWLPRGVLIVLAGRQGAGKTTWGAHLVGALTRGGPFPDGTHCTPMWCGMLSLEESDGRQVARLKAAGANLDRVVMLGQVERHDSDGRTYDTPWGLPDDCALLAERIKAHNLGVVTVDGLGYAIEGDSHSYSNVGAALAALGQVASLTGCTIIGLTHIKKGPSDPVTAAIGSTAWTAIPRVCWVLGYAPEQDDVPVMDRVRVVRVPKSNYILPDDGWGFSLANDPEFEAGYVTGLHRNDCRAEDLTNAPADRAAAAEREAAKAERQGEKLARQADKEAPRQEAIEFLTEELASGPRPAKELRKAATDASITADSLRRAREAVCEKPYHEGFEGGGIWWWKLAPHGDGTCDTGDGTDEDLPSPVKSCHLRPDLGFLDDDDGDSTGDGTTGPCAHGEGARATSGAEGAEGHSEARDGGSREVANKRDYGTAANAVYGDDLDPPLVTPDDPRRDRADEADEEAS